MSQHIGGGKALACLCLGLGFGIASPTATAQPVPAVALSLHASSSTAIELLLPAEDGARPPVTVPAARLAVDDGLQGLIDDLLSRSPAFRRQWQRLLKVPRLSVRLELVHTNHVLDAHAATTVSANPDGSLEAVVAIPGGRRLAELVAHEVEHVLERLDGVRVAGQHALGDPSVRRAASGSFETARAVRVGQLVARELGQTQR